MGQDLHLWEGAVKEEMFHTLETLLTGRDRGGVLDNGNRCVEGNTERPAQKVSADWHS